MAETIQMPSVHSPEAITPITIGEKKLVVKEMPWPKAIAFLKIIGDAIGGIVEIKADGSVKVDFNIAKIVSLIASSENAISHLLEHGTNLTPDEVNNLTTAQCLRCLKRAVEVNLNDEIIGAGKELGVTLRGRLVAEAK